MENLSAFCLTRAITVDENFPKAAVDVLCKEGHDVLWIRAFAPGTKGKDVLF